MNFCINTGPRFHELDPDHPLYVGYMHFSKHAPWMQERYREGRISPNASYDQTVVLCGVRGGVGKYWGDKKISEALLNAKFDKPITEFRCYKLRL